MSGDILHPLAGLKPGAQMHDKIHLLVFNYMYAKYSPIKKHFHWHLLDNKHFLAPPHLKRGIQFCQGAILKFFAPQGRHAALVIFGHIF